MVKIIIMSIFLISGLFFFLVGTIGLLRFPSVFTRVHATSKCDTLGFILCLVSLMIYSGINFITVKLVVILIFVWITNPTATHLIAKSKYFKEGNKNESI